MSAIILDTESTGLKDAQLIEVAYCPFTLFEPDDDPPFYQQYRPTCDIEYGAMATHNILPGDLIGMPSPDTFVMPSVDYIIWHNIDFDWKMVGSPNVKRICTLALSRHFYPEVDRHTQSAMMYYAYGAAARPWLKDAHNALADVLNCNRLLNWLIIEIRARGHWLESTEDLWIISEMARVPTVMGFGKHKGEPIASVPVSYIQWYLKQDLSDADPYLVKALRERLRG